MLLEVKVVLEGSTDSCAVMKALDNRRLSEETHRDSFFDFRNGALAEMNSVLRLRTLCLKPGEEASPLLASAAGGHAPVVAAATAYTAAAEASSGGVPSSFEAFMEGACAGGLVDEEHDTPHNAYTAYGTAGAPVDSPAGQTALLMANAGNQQVVLLPGQTGKLVLKEGNTVDCGEQMSFVYEDAAVPADVVAALVQGHENPFDVLSAYAERTPTGSTARSIVHQLRALAHQQQQKDAQLNPLPSQDQAGSYQYTRYAGVTATPPRSQQSRDREIDSLPCALVCTGSYITTRTTFRYLNTANTTEWHENMAADERAMWNGLQLRLDATLYPFGEQFEVEIPKVPCAFLDDVKREVFSFLRYLRVRFQPASEGKYARFVQGMRSLHARKEEIQDIKIRLTSLSGYNEVRQNLESIALPSAAAPSINPYATGTTTMRSTQTTTQTDPRRITNLDVDRSYVDATSASTDVIEEEQQENYFFDGPESQLRQQQCFLRLRRVHKGAKYVLVLKERQSFTEGTQDTQTQKTPLPGDVAESLIKDPTAFLTHHHESNAIANTLWNYFNLRQLTGVAHFSTVRLKVPWRAAQAQRYVPERASTQMLTAPAPVPVLSALQQENAQAASVVPPLIIHLDRTQFELPRAATGVPGFTQHIQADFSTGRRTYEMYEVEVTNLLPSTLPSHVLAELTAALDWLGVEWQYGTQSKLDQFYALLDAAAAPQTTATGIQSAGSLFDRWSMQQ